uniref:Uncharacterized protein n=1 Tax=Aegilops tauschii subsp. strangulata TaxID=200361 RepID=A0A453LIJ6_AEGTS
MNRSTIFLRGAGGFSDSSRPYSYTTYPANQISRISIPNSAPSAVYEDQTQQSQRHSYTGYLGIIILCIQTLWLHRLQGSPVQYCTASALWGSRPGRSSSRSATGIQRRCGTSSAGSCCTSTPARRWSPRCGSTARGCSTRPRRRSVTAPCFPDTCCSNTSPHHCKCCEEYTYFLIGALIS